MAGALRDDNTGHGASSAWVQSGASALTGPPPGGLLPPPPALIPTLTATGERASAASAALGHRVEPDWLGLLCDRARITGLTAHGRVSCGGATTLMGCADDWLAISLARPTDVDLLEPLLRLAGATSPWRPTPPDPSDSNEGGWRASAAVWEQLADHAAPLRASALADAAALLGLPLGVLGERPPDGDTGVSIRTTHRTARFRSTDSLRVADLSTLWAGPLCGSLFAACGADVTKVSSTARPDGALAGHGAWYEHLNRHKTHLEVALDTPSGRGALEALIAGADVVIESARPRGLEQLGIVAESLVASRTGPQVWISITGHGRRSPRVAFGDDAAVAGGLVVTDDAGPWFCADAVADPLSGIAAFAAALECLVRGDNAVVDVAMSGVAAAHAAPDAPQAGTPTPLTEGADRNGR